MYQFCPHLDTEVVELYFISYHVLTSQTHVGLKSIINVSFWLLATRNFYLFILFRWSFRQAIYHSIWSSLLLELLHIKIWHQNSVGSQREATGFRELWRKSVRSSSFNSDHCSSGFWFHAKYHAYTCLAPSPTIRRLWPCKLMIFLLYGELRISLWKRIFLGFEFD